MTAPTHKHHKPNLSILCVLVFTAFWIFILAVFFEKSFGSYSSRILVHLSGEAEGITLHCWEQEPDHYCVFLPSFAEMNQVSVSAFSLTPICLDGIRLSSKQLSCSRFKLNTPYSLQLGSQDAVLQFFQSSGTASMFLSTRSGSMKSIHTNKNHKEQSDILLLSEDGVLDYRSSLPDYIRGRGKSSWGSLKKPYSLLLGAPAKLLNLKNGAHWALVTNSDDITKLRNKLIYSFASTIGPYPGFAPGCEYVDLFLNGEYAGLYLLVEAIEIQSSRLDIDRESTLFNLDLSWPNRMADYKSPFHLNPGIAVEINYPDPCPDTKKADLQERLSEFQLSLSPENSSESWLHMIDLESWARKYLIEEVFANYDAGSCSQYFYLDPSDGKIYAGPCWDYDNSLGAFPLNNPRCFLAQRMWRDASAYTPWYGELYDRQLFRDTVVRIYSEEFLPILEHLLLEIPNLTAQLQQAAEMDLVRWGRLLYPEGTSYSKEVAKLADFLSKRMEFLNSAWIDGQDYITITLMLPDIFAYYSFVPGGFCQDLPGPEAFGIPDSVWFREDTGERFNPALPLTKSIRLYPRREA